MCGILFIVLIILCVAERKFAMRITAVLYKNTLPLFAEWCKPPLHPESSNDVISWQLLLLEAVSVLEGRLRSLHNYAVCNCRSWKGKLCCSSPQALASPVANLTFTYVLKCAGWSTADNKDKLYLLIGWFHDGGFWVLQLICHSKAVVGVLIRGIMKNSTWCLIWQMWSVCPQG